MKHKRLSTGLITLGGCLILAAGALALCNLLDDNRAAQTVTDAVQSLSAVMPSEVIPVEVFYEENLALIDPSDPDVEVPCYLFNPSTPMPEQEIDGISYIGVLEIPALGLELPIISQWSSANAKTAPCRYAGSAYLDDLVICAHNYASHFGKLSTLSVGDRVTFTDMDGNRFVYEVLEFEVLKATQIEEMCSGNWDLTLFTCTVGGQSRVTLRCGYVKGN